MEICWWKRNKMWFHPLTKVSRWAWFLLMHMGSLTLNHRINFSGVRKGCWEEERTGKNLQLLLTYHEIQFYISALCQYIMHVASMDQIYWWENTEKICYKYEFNFNHLSPIVRIDRGNDSEKQREWVEKKYWLECQKGNIQTLSKLAICVYVS